MLLFLNYCFYYIELQDTSADNKHRKGKTHKNPNTKKKYTTKIDTKKAKVISAKLFESN